jgi:hypothetical protein
MRFMFRIEVVNSENHAVSPIKHLVCCKLSEVHELARKIVSYYPQGYYSHVTNLGGVADEI